MSFWTDERVDGLKRLYAAGLSASQIAAELGAATRNTVIGKVSRLGLTRIQHRQGNRPAALLNRKRACKPRTIKPTRFALSFNNATITKIPVADFKERLAAVVPLHLDLAQLTDTTCKYPYGEGPFTFCGCAVRTGTPYCAPHAELTRASSSTTKRMAA